MAKRPNIVFAFADDWGRYASAYAAHEPAGGLNELVSTPNFDRLAAEGALFLNALVPAPSCTPCRSSLCSGQYFWQTGLGAILEGARWDESIPSFPLELEKSGYFIGHTYKVWSPGRTANAPIGGERTQYQPAGMNYSFFSHWCIANLQELGVEGAKQVLYSEARENFRAFLEARQEQAGSIDGGEPPFFYFWGPTNTHRTWEQGSGKTLWGLEPNELEGRMPAFMPETHTVREDCADYLGECQAVDGGLGVLMAELEERGELDNTIIVSSGDHGIPGMPRAKCNLYDIGCEVALAIRWPGVIKPGTVINDLVNIMDLAPTFCEMGAISPPLSMQGKSHSLVPLLHSGRSGQVEATRDFVVTGRERHVAAAREGFLPYPQRCLRTAKYLYIVNFEPERWPMGDPRGLDDLAMPVSDELFHDIENDTRAAFPDLDASPTKAWMILHREDLDVEPLYQLAFGKRPREELYHLPSDPAYMRNLAGEPEHEAVRAELQARLMAHLTEQQDPRLVENPVRFESEPYTVRSLNQKEIGQEVSYEEALATMDAMRDRARMPQAKATAARLARHRL